MGSSDRINRQSSQVGEIIEFSDEVLKELDEGLAELLEETKSKCTLVIDRTGCILSSRGDFHPIGEDAMGATSAGIIGALNTMMARGTSPEVSVKVYGSDVDKVHFLVMAHRLVLTILYGKKTTTGQVRQAAKKFAQRINGLVEADRGRSKDGTDIMKSVQFIEQKLNDLFSEMP